MNPAEISCAAALVAYGARALRVLEEIGLCAADFAAEELGAVVSAAARLDRCGVQVDAVTLNGALGQDLAALEVQAPALEAVRAHALVVRQGAIRRQKAQLLDQIGERQRTGTDLGDLPARLAALQVQEREAGRPPKPLPTAADRVLQLWSTPRPPPVPTGLVPLDQALGGGLLRGRSTLIIARTGRGKTGFAMQVVLHLLTCNLPVLYLQTELPEDEAYGRFLGQLMRQPWREVLSWGPPAAEDLARWARERLGLLTLLELDGADSLEEILRRYIAEKGCVPIVVVDVVQDLATATLRTQRGLDARSAMREVSSRLKATARHHNTLCLLVSHTSRQFAQRSRPGKPLTASDFESAGRDSADLEQDAACVLFLDTGDTGQDGTAYCELHIAKFSGGARQTLPLRYNGPIGTFEPTARRDETRLLQDAILEILQKREASHGLSGTALKKLVRKRGLGRKEVELNAEIFGMSERGEIVERQIHKNLCLYYHPAHAPRGEQIPIDC